MTWCPGCRRGLADPFGPRDPGFDLTPDVVRGWPGHLRQVVLPFLCRHAERFPESDLVDLVRAVAGRPDADPDLIALLVALHPPLIGRVTALATVLFMKADSDDPTNPLRLARTRRVEALLILGETVWEEDRETLYGPSYEGVLGFLDFGVEPWLTVMRRTDRDAGPFVSESSTAAARRAVIRAVAADIDKIIHGAAANAIRRHAV